MVDFWIELTVARIEKGMDKEVAISKVPKAYRAAVREALEN